MRHTAPAKIFFEIKSNTCMAGTEVAVGPEIVT
jgi:hypothetical protein